MLTPPPILTDELSDARQEEVRVQIKKLERRDWWLWWMAVLVMLLLTLAVVSMTFPGLLAINDPYFQFTLNQAVRGLVALVLLFNTYTIYQQWQMKRLRRHLAEQLETINRVRSSAQQLQIMAIEDPLTGVFNRRYGEYRLTAEAARSRRHGHPLTVIALDLNKFKQINDQHGHPAGDLVLRHFAARLKNVLRESDLAVRMGGDEFLLILPECSPDHVQSVLGRLKGIEVEYKGAHIPVAYSAGWVGYQEGESPEQFLERADQTLYADKRARKRREGDTRAAEPLPSLIAK